MHLVRTFSSDGSILALNARSLVSRKSRSLQLSLCKFAREMAVLWLKSRLRLLGSGQQFASTTVDTADTEGLPGTVDASLSVKCHQESSQWIELAKSSRNFRLVVRFDCSTVSAYFAAK